MLLLLLCLQGIPRTVLQLVAVACMLLASKQDEVTSSQYPARAAAAVQIVFAP
jgi:hypothetical protein